METLNFDVVGIHNKIIRFMGEAQLANSANLSETNEYDISRLKSYLAALRGYHAYIASQPALDLVESSPTVYVLKPLPVALDIENESLQDACMLLRVMDQEIVSSQSSRRSSGLVPFDSVRFLSIVSRCERLIADYIEVSTPLDMPKTSPMDTINGPGKRGIIA